MGTKRRTQKQHHVKNGEGRRVSITREGRKNGTKYRNAGREGCYGHARVNGGEEPGGAVNTRWEVNSSRGD